MIGFAVLIFAIIQFHRREYYTSVIIFFLFLTNGFQVIPAKWLMAGLTIDKASDLAIVYVLYIALMYRKKINVFLAGHHVFRGCKYLVAFAVLSCFFSYFYYDYSIINIVQVFRSYLILFSFILFLVVPLEVLKRILNTLAIITFLQSILFLMQVVTGETLLNTAFGDEYEGTKFIAGTEINRFYNLPAFIIPMIFYYFFIYKAKYRIVQFALCVTLSLAIVAPMHRSLILAVLIVVGIHSIFQGSAGRRLLFMTFLGLLLLIVSASSIVSDRIASAVTDMRGLTKVSIEAGQLDGSESTIAYRLGHFTERLTYVISSPLRWVFGIGLISDNSKEASKLPFQLGVISGKTGQISKVDTADLTWSLLILNLGVVGTLVFSILFFKILLFFKRAVVFTPYGTMGFLTLLCGFVVSFTSTEMLKMTFQVIIVMLVVLILRLQFYLQCDRFKVLF